MSKSRERGLSRVLLVGGGVAGVAISLVAADAIIQRKGNHDDADLWGDACKEADELPTTGPLAELAKKTAS